MLVVACNEVGTHGGTELGGRSIIVDARGEVLAEGGSEEELVIAQVDIDDTLLWREQFPNLADRVL
jgi:predicted amidohydrolase